MTDVRDLIESAKRRKLREAPPSYSVQFLTDYGIEIDPEIHPQLGNWTLVTQYRSPHPTKPGVMIVLDDCEEYPDKEQAEEALSRLVPPERDPSNPDQEEMF